MSNALAIAAVTATLKDLLNDGLLDHDLSSIGSFSVTSTPPDRITTGATEPNQLNVFLYQVTPNLGWRNARLPALDPRGARVSRPPLALDLHYLLSAYGAQDLNAEVLLGYAMQLLHEQPVLTRQQLRTVLATPSPVDGSVLPSPFGSLSAADLADQIELLKITPVYLGSEELSKLWTAMQARYRPSMAYLVSVVLIQADGPARAAPPVLKRGEADRGPVAIASGNPTLRRVHPKASELLPAARLGDDLVLHGARLASESTTVRFECTRLGLVSEAAGTNATDERLEARIPGVADDPAAMAQWGIGVYRVSLRVARSGLPAWHSNVVPLALAPRIAVDPLDAVAGDFALTITCSPRLKPIQESGARLIFGEREIAPDAVITPADPLQPTTLTFTVAQAPAGEHPVRLRVDGIDSLPVTASGSPPSFDFDPQQTVTVSP
jgi:hypothetical protein